MTIQVPNEFEISPFARFYELITDTFIDTKGAAESLKNFLSIGSEIFEIGLGTGYFASLLTKDGYKVKGIQPKDEMLTILKEKDTKIKVLAECKLEDYEFTEKYETIVSHSSVFLFTQHKVPFGQHGETLTSHIFQSFIINRFEVFRCLHKVLKALTLNGKLFINIQNNPLPSVTINNDKEPLIFNMDRCDYFLELEYVEKEFSLIYKKQNFKIYDRRYCITYCDFINQLHQYKFNASISRDLRWIVINRK